MQTAQSTPEKYMRASAAALALGVDVNAVYRLAQRRKLVAIVTEDGRWKILATSVEQLRQQREREANAGHVA